MAFGFVFMIIGVSLSRIDNNVIFFIFSASFALLGLVLFMMGVINGFIEVFNHVLHRKPKKQLDTQ